MLVVIAAALLLASCGNNPSSFRPAKAKRVVQCDISQKGMDGQGLVVPVGFFECNNSYTRYQLRQLAACGIVSYECQLIPRVTTRTENQTVSAKIKGRMRTIRETRTVADTEWCCFVDVKLAPDGEALLMSYNEDGMLDRDLYWSDEKSYPEDAVDYAEFDTEDDEYYEEEAYDAEQGYSEEWDEDESAADCQDEYMSAKQRENIEWVQLKAFGLRVAKVRNLRIYEEQSNGMACPMAKGEVIVEFHDVTPVGRVVAGRYDGMRLALPCLFAYYEGDGWRIDNLDADAVFSVSSVSMQDLDAATERLLLSKDEILSQSAIEDEE